MGRHRNIIVRALGLTVMVVGLQKTAWVVYNVFIDPRPSFAESNALAVIRIEDEPSTGFLGIACPSLAP